MGFLVGFGVEEGREWDMSGILIKFVVWEMLFLLFLVRCGFFFAVLFCVGIRGRMLEGIRGRFVSFLRYFNEFKIILK